MSKNLLTFPWKIKDIPCRVRVESFLLEPAGAFSPSTFETEYTILDLRKNILNSWLQDQLSGEEEDNLLDEIFYRMTGADE